MVTRGRLRRSFPGRTLLLKTEVFDEDEFQVVLAQTFAKMSHQSAPGTQPQVRKSTQYHNEDRDTTHPKIVTELLFAYLAYVAEPAEDHALWKNTREEFLWDNARLPWRRSPLWLLIRVAMQLEFSRSCIASCKPSDTYKIFMVFLMSHVFEMAFSKPTSSPVISSMR